jgi:hypothetical protein
MKISTHFKLIFHHYRIIELSEAFSEANAIGTGIPQGAALKLLLFHN